jgi:hypothetical protein
MHLMITAGGAVEGDDQAPDTACTRSLEARPP